MDEGFDGVHLNVEPVDDGNDEFLALLRALRTAVGTSHLLSVSAIRPAPVGLPRAPNFAWSPDYYARVAATVDQIVIMAYDTALPTPSLYRRYVRWAARSVAGALDASGSDARVLMGIPTYEPFGFMHRRGVETPENALVGVVAGLRGLGAGGTFEGVALYAEWTTDEADWARLRALLAQPPGVAGRAAGARAQASACPGGAPGAHVVDHVVRERRRLVGGDHADVAEGRGGTRRIDVEQVPVVEAPQLHELAPGASPYPCAAIHSSWT